MSGDTIKPNQDEVEKMLRERELGEKVKEWYEEWKEFVQKFYDYELSPSEAAHARRIIRQIHAENQEEDRRHKATGRETMDSNWAWPEITERFFWEFYGINRKAEYVKFNNKEIFQLIKQKYRPEQELV